MKFWFSVLILSSLFLTACPDDNGTTPAEINTDCERDIVKNTVQFTAHGFSNILSYSELDEFDKEEIFRAYVSNSRFFEDSSGYFYVETLDAVMVAHGFKDELVGSSRIDVQDTKGNYYVREMLDSINKSGAGFVEFYFTNPATGKDEIKTGFVSKFKNGWDYFIGSGFYNERNSIGVSGLNCRQLLIQNLVHSVSGGFNGVFSNILDSCDVRYKFIRAFFMVNQFDYENGYVLAINKEAVCIANNYNLDIIGINLNSATDTNGKEYIKEIIEMLSLQNAGFDAYSLPDSENQTVVEYEFYFEKVPDTDIILIAFIPKT